MFRRTKGQTVAEYAILLSLVVAAAVAMQVYVKRGLQARVKKGTDAFTGITGTIDSGTGVTRPFDAQDQYEPYYQESEYNRYQENVKREKVNAGAIAIEKVADITASKAGGFDQQTGGDATTRTARDARWVTP